jgi:peptidoglycan/LPS O-acetylase OafA/YrhL
MIYHVAAMTQGKRIPALDGWRGIAILLVLIDHLEPRHWTNITNPSETLRHLGAHGVVVFFVLSGFLITGKLLEESDCGGVKFSAFYQRRFFRLMPVAWLYLALAALAGNTLRDTAECLFFVRNFFSQWTMTIHFWSLSIEEQFYLFWPFVVWRLGRRAWMVAVAGAMTIAVYRFFTWHEFVGLPNTASFGTFRRADAIMVGCAFAFLKQVKMPRWCVGLGAASLVVCIVTFHASVPLCESAVIGFLIWSTTDSKIMQMRWLRQLGTLAYSIYIWQQPLIIFESPSWIVIGAKLCIILTVAWLSYKFIERPFIEFGARMRTKPEQVAV